MLPAGAPSQPTWDSLSTMESMEEAELMAQLLSSYSLCSEHEQEPSLGFPSIFSADHGVECSYYSEHLGSTSCYWPQGCGGGATVPKDVSFLPLAGPESCYLSDPGAITGAGFEASSIAMDLCKEGRPVEDATGGNKNTSSEDIGGSGGSGEAAFAPGRKSSFPKRKLLQVPPPLEKAAQQDSSVSEEISPKKKPRSVVDVQKSGQQKKAQSREQRRGDVAEDHSNGAEKEKGCSSYSSEDDSSASQDVTNACAGVLSRSESSPSLNQQGKSRAGGRGSATNPQSLYARRRRDRINERLRVLQNLVPNGTKVDISTMLEEAVQYVKFLQLQIKLLSSDDLWMYAPLAYNGMDIGLDLKISLPQ